jgi:predicted CopG family antitoxin
MALKTFNLDKEVYEEFSKLCKKEGLSMSKKVDNFIREELKKLNKELDLNTPVKRPKDLKSPVPQPDPKNHSFRKYC